MKKTALITGARGRLGLAAVKAFGERGWEIRTLVRRATQETDPAFALFQRFGVIEYLGDAVDETSLLNASNGIDVIVPAANPSYEHWEDMLPSMTSALINVATVSAASIVFPANVYNYGETMPHLLAPNTPQRPSCSLGQLRHEMETALKEASEKHGVQTLLVRAGGYMDGRDTGNWVESYMCKNLHKNEFMYPGRMDVDCAWAYLPDVADVMVQIAEARNRLQEFEDIGLPGYSMTGDRFKDAVETAIGKSLKRTRLPWAFIKVLGWFVPKMKGVYDLRYLFSVPHKIDGTRLAEILPNWTKTPLDVAMRNMFTQQSADESIKPVVAKVPL